MQFYKKRDFGELISATFDFVKIYGKDYFKKYLLMNGLIILLLLVVIAIGFGEIFTQALSGNLGGQQYYFEEYFDQNSGILILVGVIITIIFVLLSLVSYSFPVLYIKRVSETGAREVSIDQMTSDLKKIVPKFLKFLLGSLLIFVPLIVILMGISGILMFLIIGVFLMILLIPAFINLMNFTFFHYYHTDEGFFSSIGYAFSSVLSKSFWKYWGSIAIVYILIQVLTSVFTFIPAVLMAGADLSGGAVDESSWWVILIGVGFYALAIIASLILTNLIYINTAFMYYDSRLDLHRDVQLSEIDSIGKREI